MAVFDWMRVAKTKANSDPAFRALFQAFQIESVTEADVDSIKDDDILIAMSTREWNSYLYRRRLGRAPSLLGLDAEKDDVIQTKDIGARLQFERISRSIQTFVDYGARTSGR